MRTDGHGDPHFLPYEWAIDTVEHGFYLDEESIDLFHETGATFVPTLAIVHRIVEAGADHGVPEYGLAKARETWEAHVELTSRTSARRPRSTRAASRSRCNPPGLQGLAKVFVHLS